MQTWTSRGFLYPQTSQSAMNPADPMTAFWGSPAGMISSAGLVQDVLGSGKVSSSTSGLGTGDSSLGAVLPASKAKELGRGGEMKYDLISITSSAIRQFSSP